MHDASKECSEPNAVLDPPSRDQQRPNDGNVPEQKSSAAERALPTLESTAAADRYEMDMFKSTIDLSAFAASRGYCLDKKESSARNRVMRLGPPKTGDKINISRAPDGHWQYYSIRSYSDNGTIVDFVQNRVGGSHKFSLGQVRKELREWTHTERELPEFARVEMKPIERDFEQIAREVASSRTLDTHPYLESRGLRKQTLSDARFRGTWREADDKYRNVIFPHHNSAGLSGYEKKNFNGFTGFSSGGAKGLWVSNTTPADNRLVITESAIDALSYHQLHPHPRARYISLGGKENPDQPGLLEKAISLMPAGSTVVAATDHDKDGREFAERIAVLCAKHSHVSFERHEPKLVRMADGEVGKDWNDNLRDLIERSPRTEAAHSGSAARARSSTSRGGAQHGDPAPQTLRQGRFRGTWTRDSAAKREVAFVYRDERGTSVGADQGLWRSIRLSTDRALVVTENPREAMSYHELNSGPCRTRYASLGANPSSTQLRLLAREIESMPAGSVVVAAGMNGPAGNELEKRVIELCESRRHVLVEKDRPSLSTSWSEQIREIRTRAMGLDQKMAKRSRGPDR